MIYLKGKSKELEKTTQKVSMDGSAKLIRKMDCFDTKQVPQGNGQFQY